MDHQNVPTPGDDQETTCSEPSENKSVENSAAAEESAIPASNASDAQSALQEKYDTLHEQYVRLAADFDNFRKRSQQERESLLKYGAEHTISNLIATLDNLERAAKSLSEESDPKTLYQSFRLVYNQLLDAFDEVGAKKIETVGQPFDPTRHEAIARVETDEQPEDTVVDEHQSGYMLHDRVIRPALVRVAASPEPNTSLETDKNNGSPDKNPFQDVSGQENQFVPDDAETEAPQQ